MYQQQRRSRTLSSTFRSPTRKCNLKRNLPCFFLLLFFICQAKFWKGKSKSLLIVIYYAMHICLPTFYWFREMYPKIGIFQRSTVFEIDNFQFCEKNWLDGVLRPLLRFLPISTDFLWTNCYEISLSLSDCLNSPFYPKIRPFLKKISNTVASI